MVCRGSGVTCALESWTWTSGTLMRNCRRLLRKQVNKSYVFCRHAQIDRQLTRLRAAYAKIKAMANEFHEVTLISPDELNLNEEQCMYALWSKCSIEYGHHPILTPA